MDKARANNRQAIDLFFQYFMRDWSAFRALWTEAPRVEIPFAPAGMPREYRTDREFDGFWKPIFESFSGKFDWTIVELIHGEDPDVIVALTKSDVDVAIPSGSVRYQADYIQVFRFQRGKIAVFREYVDSAFMNKVYGLG
jgi:ketosteroid isomerase-like protein